MLYKVVLRETTEHPKITKTLSKNATKLFDHVIQYPPKTQNTQGKKDEQGEVMKNIRRGVPGEDRQLI